MQYNCTAEFAVDVIPSVDTIESVNVTVSGPYGSASSLKNMNQSECYVCIYITTCVTLAYCIDFVYLSFLMLWYIVHHIVIGIAS